MPVENHDFPPLTVKPAYLPEKVGMYVDALTKKHEGVEQVWVLRTPGAPNSNSKWELLLFADERRLAAIRADSAARRDDVDLLVVIDGDRFESVWDERRGRLSGLDWRLDGPQAAEYRRAADEPGTGDERAVAHRVR